ncbi:sigma factor-like helix-turn-helix DNA-binding protein [Streptomyces halobius]|uniref:RNA polymerase sigma factor 70 region 4 type 2 domain-containing protein n=1 Tax=Streptomyces halobius TaxID=2879846 RepID=A0ABY4M829_9ACTN|nr:sigma factor-like helix-turn-helix DNA-binding protein [Streptomyces halobius]UQA93512.1 hypothetical protein K9S39_18120 [Streptomyces halobius]
MMQGKQRMRRTRREQGTRTAQGEVRTSRHAPLCDVTGAGPAPAPPADSPSGALSEPSRAATAFDALYDEHAAPLTQQAYLLTGQPRSAQQAVERAFQLAWRQWPEVATAPNPAAWVRAAAYEEALSPWRPLLRRRRAAQKPTPKAPAPAPAAPADRAFLETLLALPVPYRRTLLLHDGLGLGIDETAAELEASPTAAARRLAHARETVALRLPELGLDRQTPARKGEILHARISALAAAHPVAPPPPRTVRTDSERSTRWTTRAAFGLTGLVAATTALSLLTAPRSHTPPPERRAATAPASPRAPASPGTQVDYRDPASPQGTRAPTGRHPGTPAPESPSGPQPTLPPDASLTPALP